MLAAMDSQRYTVYAKDSKDVPDWMKATHDWQNATPVDKLPKYQLKVEMCCFKCEEKVIEEIREVPGVFDVRAERLESKVVVVAKPPPNGLVEHEVLKKAKKINKKAKFVELDAKEKPKKDNKKEDGGEKKGGEAKKKEKLEESNYTLKPIVHWGGPPLYYARPPVPYYPGEYRLPVPYYPGEYRPSQSYPPREHYPVLPNQPQDGYYRQYTYY